MRLSQGVEWAVHSCTVLASVPADRALPAAKLAEFHGVPGAYLAKHLQALSAAEIVTSVPGPLGGYRLARTAEEITLLDIVLAVDGDESSFVCTEIRQRGPAGCKATAYPKPCGIARAMWAAEVAWRDALQAQTVADIVASMFEEAPREGFAKGAVWLREVIR